MYLTTEMHLPSET